jgi:hypothetical protein
MKGFAMNSIMKDSIITVAKEQVSCDLAGETAILDLKSGQYYGLNPVGARIWELLQESRSVTDVLTSILDEYDVEAESCERDLLALLEELHGKGLLDVKDAPAK